MRAFWEIGHNNTVGLIIKELIKRIPKPQDLSSVSGLPLRIDCEMISHRLLGLPLLNESDYNFIADCKDFGEFAYEIFGALRERRSNRMLNTLHTYFERYVRKICKKHDIEVYDVKGKKKEKKPLYVIYEKYVETLKNGKYLDSSMTERIMEFNVEVMGKFNNVRNYHSLAHDNQLLNEDESQLITYYIISLMQFIITLESKIENPNHLVIK
ncbi:hypothetical protein [Bartonella sp. CB74]|uniref:hypothetical protein n=1 Tax=Bartonella sp. CB74 TaxID=3113620 RepID=UPI002F96B0B2